MFTADACFCGFISLVSLWALQGSFSEIRQNKVQMLGQREGFRMFSQADCFDAIAFGKSLFVSFF